MAMREIWPLARVREEERLGVWSRVGWCFCSAAAGGGLFSPVLSSPLGPFASPQGISLASERRPDVASVLPLACSSSGLKRMEEKVKAALCVHGKKRREREENEMLSLVCLVLLACNQRPVCVCSRHPTASKEIPPSSAHGFQCRWTCAHTGGRCSLERGWRWLTHTGTTDAGRRSRVVVVVDV